MRFRTILLAEANSEYSIWLLSCFADLRLSVVASVRAPTVATAVGLEHAPDLALFGVESLGCPMFAAGATLATASARTQVLFYSPLLTPDLIREVLAVGGHAASRSWTTPVVQRVISSLLLRTCRSEPTVAPRAAPLLHLPPVVTAAASSVSGG